MFFHVFYFLFCIATPSFSFILSFLPFVHLSINLSIHSSGAICHKPWPPFIDIQMVNDRTRNCSSCRQIFGRTFRRRRFEAKKSSIFDSISNGNVLYCNNLMFLHQVIYYNDVLHGICVDNGQYLLGCHSNTCQ